MAKFKSLVTFLIFSSMSHFALSQVVLKNYVVLTFEDSYKISGENPRIYNWIVPQDSIKFYNNSFSVLLLDHYNKNNLVDCCNGKDTNPFVIEADKKHDLNMDTDYEKGIDNLKEIISKKRKKIQTIIKVWESGQKETISIFATPVTGKFCSLHLDTLGKDQYKYFGEIYMPYSSFSYSPQFWKSDKSKFILNRDLSETPYKVIPLL